MTIKNLSLLLFFTLIVIQSNAQIEWISVTYKQVPIGSVVDMTSLVGQSVHSCINLAISDFYARHNHYRTRIVHHTRDSGGEPLGALSASLDLLENINVQAIIGSETPLEARLLAIVGDKAKVPILSFSAKSSSSTEYPYFFRISQEEKTQFTGIAVLVESFKWRDVIIIHEDSDYGRDSTHHLADSLQDRNIHVSYKSIISPEGITNGDRIIEELRKLKNMQAKVFVVHLSPSLSTILFSNAKRLGMMSEGYAWILTDNTINQLQYMDSKSIESMQGVVGFKSYIPQSNEVYNLTMRWRKENYYKNSTSEVRELNIFSIWAYDAVWALAKAVEGSVLDLKTLLYEMLKVRFKGLSGDFQLINGSVIPREFEVVNVIGKGERSVGIWRPGSKIIDLEAIIWPGGSVLSPKRLMMGIHGKKLRIGVPINRGFSELTLIRDAETNMAYVSGFCIDVFEEAIKGLKYDVAYEFIPFVGHNGLSEGSMNDLIDQVYIGNFDAVVGDTSITAERSLFVDFTLPFTDIGLGVVARRSVNKNMWIFLEPLDGDLWITIAAFLVLTGFVIWVIEHRINEEFQGSPSQQVGVTVWFTFSTLVFAHREKLVSNLSRFVTTIWVLVVLILTSSYTATLSSLLTVQQIRLASTDFIGYHGNNLAGGVTVRNLNFNDDRLKPYSSPAEYADALTRGNKNGGVGAIIDEIPYIKIFLAKYPGEYEIIAYEYTTSGFGFAFPKGSTLASDISSQILRLRETEILKMLEKRFFHDELPLVSQPQESSAKPKTLNLVNFSGLFLISGVASASALLIFLICLFKVKLVQVNGYIFEILATATGKLAFMLSHLFSKKVNEIALTNRT